MYRARTIYLPLLLFLFTIAAPADPILTFQNSSRTSPRDLFSAFDQLSSSANVLRSASPGPFAPLGLQLKLAHIKRGGTRSRNSESAFTPPRLDLTFVHLKDDAKHKKYKNGNKYKGD